MPQTARLERLVNLLAALIDTERPLSQAELRERVPGYSADKATGRRAFERDKDALRNMGIPIVTEPLDRHNPEFGEGYRVLPEDYYLPDPGFTRDEIAALALAASAVRLKSQSAAAALWKLGAHPVELQATNEVELPESDELETIFSARRERRTITFNYKNQERRLDPYRLTFRNGRWYVNGFSHSHEDVRTFRLDRMEGEIKTSARDAFAPPAPTDQPWLPPWRMGDQAPINVEVFVDASQADMAIAQSGADSVKRRTADGGVVLDLVVTNRDALRSFVLGFLEHGEVLSPPEVRGEIADHLRAMVSA